MKVPLRSLLLLIALLCFGCNLFAQTEEQTIALVKQAEMLHSQGKNDEAIAKYNEALKADPENASANYSYAFTLYTLKRGPEGIPYLEKVTKSTTKPGLVVGAYNLLGTVYDDDHQPQKAIAAFNEAIKLAPNFPEVYNKLGLAYFRNNQYAEAEAAAIEAIKHQPKSANVQRMYALVTFHQNKRANALLGFCSFLLLEPTGPRAEEAYGNIQHILQGGVLKSTSVDSKETIMLNAGIIGIATAAKAKKLTGEPLLEYELKGIFTMVGQAAEKNTDKTFFDSFFAAYLYKLAQSPNMPAFTKMVMEHTPLSSDLDNWVKGTERGF